MSDTMTAEHPFTVEEEWNSIAIRKCAHNC